MIQFSVPEFTGVTSLLNILTHNQYEGGETTMSDKDHTTARESVDQIVTSFRRIYLPVSMRAAKRLQKDLEEGLRNVPTMRTRANELYFVFRDEMSAHTFLWIPNERAEWHSKTAENILGRDVLQRFGNQREIGKEAERASRCFAYGEWTASGIHMTNVAEVGVQALGKAVHCANRKLTWGDVYSEIMRQKTTAKNARLPHWATHEDFLEKAAANLHSIKPYRDDLGHYRTTYDDKDAIHMLQAVPQFMNHLASHLDETGVLF